MSRPSSRYFGRAFRIALASLAVAFPAAAQDFGLIAGRVTAAESEAALSGATVAIVGSTTYTTTDANGNFVLSRVPAGNVTVRAVFLGRQSDNKQVSVTAGQTSRVNFSLTQVTLTTVVVEASRASGQAEALTRQQYAPNIVSIVASDQMGRFPDASAPEAVQRLPGVAIDRDQGEGRYIKIRGASPANTQVTVNGEQVPSPESSERQIALDAVPIGVLDAVEVAKAITPTWMPTRLAEPSTS